MKSLIFLRVIILFLTKHEKGNFSSSHFFFAFELKTSTYYNMSFCIRTNETCKISKYIHFLYICTI